ncbi:MAG TPA: hypothetical protein DDZ20_02115, partial [Hyphomonas sp.]|nr:hypothetical protein [Hyphomonas sp.]
MSAKPNFRALIAPVVLLSVALPCAAEADQTTSRWETALADTKPIFNARLRYEGVEQEGLPEDASALTYRFRAGFETGKIFDTALLVEFDHIDDLIDDF